MDGQTERKPISVFWPYGLVHSGYDGLFNQRRRKRTYLRVPVETAERVSALYQEAYFDLSVRPLHEKLREEHAIELSYTSVKQALQGAAWWCDPTGDTIKSYRPSGD